MMLRRLVKTLGALLFLFSMFYYAMYANYSRGYEHARYMIDDDRRLPLWYPYQLLKRAHPIEKGWDGMEINDWRIYFSGPEDKPFAWKRSNYLAPSVTLKNILRVNTASNVVCGVFEDNKNDNGSMMANSRRRLFLFASGMPEIRFYDDEDAFVLDCAKCDIDGRDLKSFEDCYGTFVSSEENMGVGDVFCDVLKYPYVSGITFDDLLLLLFVFLIWWFICGRFIIKKRLS